MKKNSLRVPLINSAIILVILTLLIYINSTDPDATLLSSISLLVIAVLKTLQLVFALLLGITFCLAFFFAIFFGAVALFSPTTSFHMYTGFRQTLASWFLPLQEHAMTWLNNRQVKNQPSSVEPVSQELKSDIETIRSQLHTTREILTIKIDQLAARINDLEIIITGKVDNNQVDVLSEELKGALDSLDGIQGAVNSMQTCVQQTAEQIQEVSPEKVLGDLPQRVQTLEQKENIDISPLEQDIAGMQQDLAEVREKADKALLAVEDNMTEEVEQAIQTQAPQETEEEHRIFSYFDNAADKEKVRDLVASTLKKDMSYKQVIDFIVKGLDSDKGKVISSHPSLSKDYIRQCRRQN